MDFCQLSHFIETVVFRNLFLLTYTGWFISMLFCLLCWKNCSNIIFSCISCSTSEKGRETNFQRWRIY